MQVLQAQVQAQVQVPKDQTTSVLEIPQFRSRLKRRFRPEWSRLRGSSIKIPEEPMNFDRIIKQMEDRFILYEFEIPDYIDISN